MALKATISWRFHGDFVLKKGGFLGNYWRVQWELWHYVGTCGNYTIYWGFTELNQWDFYWWNGNLWCPLPSCGALGVQRCPPFLAFHELRSLARHQFLITQGIGRHVLRVFFASCVQRDVFQARFRAQRVFLSSEEPSQLGRSGGSPSAGDDQPKTH